MINKLFKHPFEDAMELRKEREKWEERSFEFADAT